MSFLFDTNALSELVRPRPAPAFLAWLETVDRADQFASAVTIAELFKGAYRSQARERYLRAIEDLLLPAVTVLPFDGETARIFGRLQAELELAGQPLEDLDVQIAATAIQYDLTLVTGNLRHFERVPRLLLSDVLAEARRAAGEASR